MSRIVLLDAGPLGLVTNPKLSAASAACTEWLQTLVSRCTRILLPEIADYEVRRELVRANKAHGIERGVPKRKLWSASRRCWIAPAPRTGGW